jgi:hypothetical protein
MLVMKTPSRKRKRLQAQSRRGCKSGQASKRKKPLFEKSGAKTFVCAGPEVVSPTTPLTQHNKVFLLLFVHKNSAFFRQPQPSG